MAAVCHESYADQVPMLVYPNPAADEITIELPGIADKQNLENLDNSGRVVLRSALSGRQKVCIGHLPPGAYIIRVGTGRKTDPQVFRKFVKE